MNMPVTLRTRDSLGDVRWDRYTHIVFPSGDYEEYEADFADRMRQWVADGGTVLGFRDAAPWLRANTLDYIDPENEEGIAAAAAADEALKKEEEEEEEEDEEGEEGAAVGAPKFTPRGADAGGESSAPRTLRFPGAGDVKEDSLDELDFLKSVSDEEPAGPATENETAAEPESAPDVATSTSDAEADSDGQTQAKTLKCAECGELNRPTEWYCERCGAELASL
jgi:hypothetical protein